MVPGFLQRSAALRRRAQGAPSIELLSLLVAVVSLALLLGKVYEIRRGAQETPGDRRA